MTVNVEVVKSPNESNVSLIRRFTKRVQGAGILPRVRGLRYHNRPETKYSRKRKTLKSITRRKEVARLIKIGKMADTSRRE